MDIGLFDIEKFEKQDSWYETLEKYDTLKIFAKLGLLKINWTKIPPV